MPHTCLPSDCNGFIDFLGSLPWQSDLRIVEPPWSFVSFYSFLLILLSPSLCYWFCSLEKEYHWGMSWSMNLSVNLAN